MESIPFEMEFLIFKNSKISVTGSSTSWSRINAGTSTEPIFLTWKKMEISSNAGSWELAEKGVKKESNRMHTKTRFLLAREKGVFGLGKLQSWLR